MSVVISYIDKLGVKHNACPYAFKWACFDGAVLLSGKKYYLDKAVSLGAKRKEKKK